MTDARGLAEGGAHETTVLNFGCRLNAAEGEVIRAHAAGLADTVIVNTCAVTLEAERQCRRAIARLRRDRPGSAIVVTGCAAQIAPNRWASIPGVARVVGNAEKLRPETWRSTGHCVAPIATQRTHPAQLAPAIDGRTRAVLDVQHGCDHACTFCIIPQGRGGSRSLPLADALAHASAIAADGIPELVLTGVDLASWRDGAATLGTLVAAILRDVPALPRLRLSTLDPAAIDDELFRVLAAEPRLMPHLHLSLQSAAALVLKRMRRRHTPAQAEDVIARARAARPGLAIGADLIAGFPTETDRDAEQTASFVTDHAIPYLHVFPYSPRPGTPAARMPQVPPALRNTRAAALREIADRNAAAFHQAQLGRRVSVVVERGDRGRTEHYARASLPSGLPLGTIATLTVASASAERLELV